MDITISKKLKHIILMGTFLSLLLSVVYYYIYTNDTYLMAHSTNLHTGNGTENCKRGHGFLTLTELYLCETGYYQVIYPTHKKVFYYRYGDSGGLGPYIVTTFIEGADIKTFKVLNVNYAIDKNNLYYTGSYSGPYYDHVGVTKTPHANMSNTSVFVDGDKYAKDSESVFFVGEKIPGANPSDFNFFVGGQSFYNFRFALSNGKIFHGNKPVSAVRDGKFFIYTQGKEIPFPCMNQGYYTTNGDPGGEGYPYQCDITESGEDEKIDIDTKSFKVINDQIYPYVKDKNYVYTCSTIGCSELHVLEGANPSTFNFGTAIPLPEDVYYFHNLSDIDRGVHNGYILGCKVYEGFAPDSTGKVERISDSYNDSCVYSIYPDL